MPKLRKNYSGNTWNFLKYFTEKSDLKNRLSIWSHNWSRTSVSDLIHFPYIWTHFSVKIKKSLSDNNNTTIFTDPQSISCGYPSSVLLFGTRQNRQVVIGTKLIYVFFYLSSITSLCVRVSFDPVPPVTNWSMW